MISPRPRAAPGGPGTAPRPGAPSPPTRKWRPFALLSSLALGIGCEREAPPGATAPSATSSVRTTVGAPVLPPELSAKPTASEAPEGAADAAPTEAPPWPGPYLVVTSSSAGIYSSESFDREAKIGYAQSGGRLPVRAEAHKTDNCRDGWYQVVPLGYVCGKYGTTDDKSPRARFVRKQPELEAILPYTYARNAKNGTPLYKSVPTPEQMYEYEPYLPGAKKRRETDEKKAPAETSRSKAAKDDATEEPLDKQRHAETDDESEAAKRAAPKEAIQAAATEDGADGGAAPKTPWWQSENVDDRLHEVSLADLSAEADDLIAKRMVKGFYVAVDKQFSWNDRPWYKTTKGLIAPADRFWTTEGFDFHGIELGEKASLPVAWSYGWRKNRPVYQLDGDKLKLSGQLERFDVVDLTGKSMEHGGKTYLETKDGHWIREAHLRVTHPGPPPADLGPKERWIDVNLTTQTLVAFEGARAVYATLVSSGKSSKDKEKDHRTPSGEWRIREKHVTTTMDGDGSAAGDLPYSIEDVPYVMYFYRAYALHGAFWHRNFGSQMSHGCVNLAPLDAKWLFYFTDPQVPSGWHGSWSSTDHPGSRVVVHE